MLKLFVLLLLAISVFAQDANVIELDPADASRAQHTWNALQKAQADWDATNAAIQKKYLDADADKSLTNCVSSGGVHIKLGWGCGSFDFSKDFRFIVPKPPEQKPTINWNNGIVVTPDSHSFIQVPQCSTKSGICY